MNAIITQAPLTTVNGHQNVRAAADPDPPKPRRPGGAPGVVSLNMTEREREDLWLLCNSTREPDLPVPRRALLNLLLDHAHLLAKLIEIKRPSST
jgi:hypothetical protein